MSTKIFVNLPVKDLGKSIDFFTELGFSFNAQFTDANATCMIISDDIHAMLLVEPFFKTFTNKDTRCHEEHRGDPGAGSRQQTAGRRAGRRAGRQGPRGGRVAGALRKRPGFHVRAEFPGSRRAHLGSAVHGPQPLLVILAIPCTPAGSVQFACGAQRYRGRRPIAHRGRGASAGHTQRMHHMSNSSAQPAGGWWGFIDGLDGDYLNTHRPHSW